MTAVLETFAKVRALHDRTDNPGEKAAAAGRMDALARSAGMTTAEAVSKLDAPPSKAAGPSFADIFDTPFFRETMAQRDREREERWREVLAEYGSEEAVFAPSAWERALDAACDRHVVRAETTGWRMGSLSGWDLFSFEDPPDHIAAAVSEAYPLPATVRAAWVEFRVWDKLGRDREARGSGCGDHSSPVDARRRIIERMLNTMPAAGLADLRARMDWMDWLNDLESAPDPKEDRVRLATLRADIERLGARLREQEAETVQDGHPIPQGGEGSTSKSQNSRPDRDRVQDGQQQGSAPDAYPSRRTNAQKRADVLALLGQGLADREIARRAGVSPQTVGNIRKARS